MHCIAYYTHVHPCWWLLLLFRLCVCVCVRVSHSYDHSLFVYAKAKSRQMCIQALRITVRKMCIGDTRHSSQTGNERSANYSLCREFQSATRTATNKKKVEQMQLSNLFIYIDGKMVRVDASKDQPGKNPYAYYEFSGVAASLLPYLRAALIHVCAHSSSCTFHRVFVVFFYFFIDGVKLFHFIPLLYSIQSLYNIFHAYE